MFHQPKNSSSRLSSLKRSIFILIAAAFLATGPVCATDPIDVDPDPDQPITTTQHVVDDLAQIDPAMLPPGRHLIIVISEDGTQEVFEMIVPE